MRAQHPGTCVACSRHHLKVGDKIQRRLGGYAAERCAEQQDHIRSLASRVGSDMRGKEGIVLGLVGANGCRGITTREGFYRRANELGHCSLQEFTELQSYFSTIGRWCAPIED